MSDTQLYMDFINIFDKDAEPRTKHGDIYHLGAHRLMCGDSTSAEDVKKMMGDAHGKILFTSPPYADLRIYEGGDMSIGHITSFIKIFRPYTDYQCINLGIIICGREIVPYWNEYIRVAHEAGYKLMAWNVWDKLMCGSPGPQMAFIPIRHEWIFVFGTEYFNLNRTWEKKPHSIKTREERPHTSRRNRDGTMSLTSCGDKSNPFKKMESVLRTAPELGAIRSDHPATFPVTLPTEYIKAMTDECDIVIEPFEGSGTTLIAAEMTGRACYAMELSPRYCDIVISRYENMTGKKAIKEIANDSK